MTEVKRCSLTLSLSNINKPKGQSLDMFRKRLWLQGLYNVFTDMLCFLLSALYDCKHSEIGHEYAGFISVTRSGHKCQAWTEDYPHV